MKKLTTILFISILFSTAPIAAKVVETWECTEAYETKVLVKARIFEGRKYGRIEVAGTEYSSKYQVQGFNRRWDFDPRDDEFKYALIIKPNGDGLYYEFLEEGGSVSPSMRLKCSN
jgi:hypothetical protein